MPQYRIMIGKKWGTSPTLIRANNEKYKETIQNLAAIEGCEVLFPADFNKDTIVKFADDAEPNMSVWEKNDLFLFKSAGPKEVCCKLLETCENIQNYKKEDQEAFTGAGTYIKFYTDDNTQQEFKWRKINYCPFCGKQL